MIDKRILLCPYCYHISNKKKKLKRFMQLRHLHIHIKMKHGKNTRFIIDSYGILHVLRTK